MDAALQAPFEDYTEVMGMELHQFKFVVSLVIALALSPFYVFFKTPTARHLFSFIPGLFMAFFIYDFPGINIVIMVLYFYLIMKHVDPIIAPHVSLFALMAHLIYGHIYRYKYYYLFYTSDWTVSGMLLVFRLAGTAWSIRDGYVIRNRGKDKETDRLYSLLTPQQKEAALDRKPTFLELLGLSFFFPGFTGAPYPEAKRYIEFAENRGVFSGMPSPLSTKNNKKLVKTSLLLGVYALCYFSLVDVVPEERLQDREFVNSTSLLYRIGYMLLSVHIGSCKYYVVWTFGELANMISGVSYNGGDDWNACTQMDLKKFFTFTSVRKVSSCWNKCPQNYLKLHTYQRLCTVIPVKDLALVVTFLLSSIWHGIYPGYTIFFMSCILFAFLVEQTSNKLIPFVYNEDGTPKSDMHKKVHTVIGWALSQYALAYSIVSFRALSLEKTLIAWKAVGFTGHIMALAYFLFGLIFLPKVPRAYKKVFPYLPSYQLTD